MSKEEIKELYKKINRYDEGLKPCPFCGASAEMWQYSPSERVSQKVVMCSNGDDNSGCPMYMPPEGFYKATKREAVEAWNSRAYDE